MDARARYDEIADDLAARNDDVALGQMMGMPAIKRSGKMIGGFGVIAYPARYGASGIMSFIVNQDGVVYQKDLGKDTAAIAAQIAIFNPDASWKRP